MFKISTSNKTIAMHVSQRLVYISGTNEAYVMILNVACAWESWLSATLYFMSITCLVAEILYSSTILKCENIATVMLLTVVQVIRVDQKWSWKISQIGRDCKVIVM